MRSRLLLDEENRNDRTTWIGFIHVNGQWYFHFGADGILRSPVVIPNPPPHPPAVLNPYYAVDYVVPSAVAPRLTDPQVVEINGEEVPFQYTVSGLEYAQAISSRRFQPDPNRRGTTDDDAELIYTNSRKRVVREASNPWHPDHRETQPLPPDVPFRHRTTSLSSHLETAGTWPETQPTEEQPFVRTGSLSRPRRFPPLPPRLQAQTQPVEEAVGGEYAEEGAVGGVQDYEDDPNYGLVDAPLVFEQGGSLYGEGFGPFTTLRQTLNADPELFHKDCYLLVRHDVCEIKEHRLGKYSTCYLLGERYLWVYHPGDPDDEPENKPAFCLPPLYMKTGHIKGLPLGIVQPPLLAVGSVARNMSQGWDGCKPAAIVIKVIVFRRKDAPLSLKRTWGRLPTQIRDWMDAPCDYENTHLLPSVPATNRNALGFLRRDKRKYMAASYNYPEHYPHYNSVTLLCSRLLPCFPPTVTPAMVIGHYALLVGVTRFAEGAEFHENQTLEIVYSRLNPELAPVLVYFEELDQAFECEQDVGELTKDTGRMLPWIKRKCLIRAYAPIQMQDAPAHDGIPVPQSVLQELGAEAAHLDQPHWILAENAMMRAGHVPGDHKALRNLEARYPRGRLSPMNPWAFDRHLTPGVAELTQMLGGAQ